MRNTFAARRQRTSGFESGTSREFAEFGNSPDQLAVVWSGGQSGIVAASPKAGPSGVYSLDLARFPSDFNLGNAGDAAPQRTGTPAAYAEDSTLYRAIAVF